MRIGFDIDGVLHDFAHGFFNFLYMCTCGCNYDFHSMYEHNMRFGSEVPHWYFYRDFGMTDEDFVKHCHMGVDAGIVFSGNTRPGASLATREVKNMGHTIHLITDRPFGNARMVTQDWAREHDIHYDTLTFSADKTCFPTDMFVEDKIENYDALDAVGTEVYLINRPWNLQQDNRRRLNSVTEYSAKVSQRTYSFMKV